MNKTLGIIIAVLVLLVGVSVYALTPKDASADVRTAAATFGAQLQKVSLLAPSASSTIASTYAPYVTDNLLTSWEQNPMQAPGRTTSSPWPDRLEVSSVAKQDDGTYAVSGSVIEKTSAGDSGTFPVSMTLTKADDAWKISAFSGYPPAEQNTVPSSASTASPASTTTTAPPASGTTITVTGKIVCLPHKDTTGPQTLECAFGLQTDAGTYYALSDTSQQPTGIAGMAGAARVEVTGTLAPHANSRYQDVGVISVTRATVISQGTQ